VWCRSLAVVLASVCVGAGWFVLGVASVAGDVCPNEHIRLQEGDAAALPDCRGYEQVSPVEKNLNDALGAVSLVQSSTAGERVTFVSLSPFAGIPGAAYLPTYLASRRGGPGGEGEWSTEGLLPRTETRATGTVHVLALTEDLSEAFVSVGASQYLYSADGSLFMSFPPLEVFSGASADDSQILFESERQLESERRLVEGARSGVPNLYEWDAGRLLLVGVLEGEKGTPEGGVVAGAGGLSASYRSGRYTQGTISEDGSRVFFTALKTGRIYMREPQVGRTVPVSKGRAEWLASTPDGAYVFYTEDGGLYRFDVATQKQEPLTQGAAREAPEVQGMFGVSSDGSYAYFVAKGILSGKNNKGHSPTEGAENLYEWHEGSSTPVTYITSLREESAGDESDWRGYAVFGLNEDASGEKSSRVTSGGEVMLFSSVEPLTPYDNNGTHELYLYNATDAKLTCVSCNPGGQEATTGAYFAQKIFETSILPTSRNSFLTRNLSEDGERVFFQTEEALVPKDSNGVSDVYEWENGHLYLISSGQGDNASFFGDASANGDDVFFFTRQRLVSGDQDDNLDVYDARVDGGIAAQNPVITPPCVGEECHGQLASAPVFSAPASAVYSGAGNLAPQPSTGNGGGSGTEKKLASALRACQRKTSSRGRAACRTRAKQRYAVKSATG
jgi:hypothetical protein